ncbi:putative serine/threonine-protein kinase [Heracleum sosnowskyi]|uniref:Serine/threonine-protein kinase n=1 Tax=Heracleum sosnowskyi TaxID=360622 RepID=A0AAD8J0T4_9APIA|nr:putative serine/threonine-protein kinase [Heracleum sosnowskyi]
MGNCCIPFAGHDDSDEIAMESLPLHSEGNGSPRISRQSDMQATASLTTYTSFPKYTPENQRKKGQYAFRGYHASFGRIPGSSEAELIAAGWPSWMVEYAGEALKGWVPRKEKSFQRLETIGEGTYSQVYRALDLEQHKIVALKKIKVNDLEPETIRFMAREINILRRLHHPNIIKLEGLVASEMSCSLYLVLEYMEHDLAGLASHPGLKFTEPQIKCYMKQLFCGLDYCHRQGILHRDIKGSNLLLDNNGNLKIADFGLANFYDPQKVHPLTNRVVTLWYRPPELLLGATCYGSSVDIWSAGCILAELYVGEPIFPGRTEVDQLHRIFMLCGSPSDDYWSLLKLSPPDFFNPQKYFTRRVAEIFKGLPAPALALIETLLSIDPSARQSAIHALNSEFFLSEPLPCKPEELPKYPPSKELNAQVRDEARRQAAGESKSYIDDVKGEGSMKSRAIPELRLNAELYLSMLASFLY